MASSGGSTDSEPVVGTASRLLDDLELELVRVRNEARAARFEARAAEIELQVRRMRSGNEPLHQTVRLAEKAGEDGSTEAASAIVSPASNGNAPWQPADDILEKKMPTAPPTAPPTASGWEERAVAAKTCPAPPTISTASRTVELSPPLAHDGSESTTPKARDEESRSPSQSPHRQTQRHARGHPAPAPPVIREAESRELRETKGGAGKPKRRSNAETRSKGKSQRKTESQGKAKPARQGVSKARAADQKTDPEKLVSPRSKNCRPPLQTQPPSSFSMLPIQELRAGDDDAPATERRRRPAAWFMSVVTHIVVLMLLAGFTLSVPEPQDQLTFSASAAPAAAEELESLTIEPVESTDDSSEQVPNDEAVEIDPLGDSAAPQPVSVDTLAPAAPAEMMAVADAFDSSELLLSSDTGQTTEFCGIAGGGNHFCYIVDSSLSMKGGRFDSARAELLKSIGQLNEDQRFYVIFYNTNVDRMCISDPSQSEDYSVNATIENKRALQRWAMQVGLERGAPPDKALEFAFTLRPDVIFLLSDGEFPQRIEDLVAELNRKESLFGDEGPRSILHTIGYHSQDGEARMRRLAESNGGRYHYVPKPTSF